ncbi:hypothetical protein GALMADRAFT_686240 [Galerina marginata CBS 339.88]|uniref:Uncharacterized protein n=1 Tax=Galerina marginata (strain CBS 339.88) TaxID=685588 RepID=A0A067TL41_GALM3|nr:hypothetical protein GALMADRAFT_686240 [Galerina marginata CBS 339.88]
MSSLEGTSERSIKDEIIALAGDLAQNQSRLERLVERLEQREKAAENWETRYEDLEVSHKEAVNSAKWLRAQNMELEQKLQQHRPELDRALSAREGAFRKLKHARKVIRDLLQERGDMASPLPGSPGHLTQEDIDEVLHDDYDDSSSSSSSAPDSDRTVRLSTVPPSQISSPHRTPSSLTQLSPLSPAIIPPRSGDAPGQLTRSPTTSESLQSLQALVLSPNSSRMSPDTWQIHFKKPPAVSVVQEGPITWTSLQNSVGLSEDTMNSLQRFANQDFAVQTD